MVIQKHAGLINMTEIISTAIEYVDLSIRHGKDSMLRSLATRLPIKLQSSKFKDPHEEANLLRQVTRLSLFCLTPHVWFCSEF